jgi:hypothetical protein
MKSYLFTLAMLSSFAAITQSQPVACTSEIDKNKDLLIYATNKTVGMYTLSVSFPIFEGYEMAQAKPDWFVVPNGKKQLIRLTPKKGAQPDVQFSFKSYEGKIFNKSPENSFVYWLPAKEGKTITYLESQSIAERIGKEPPKDYLAYYFQLKEGDTICAMREGVVTKINDDIRQGANLNMAFNANRNQIKIEQQDGTLAQYTFVSPIVCLTDVGRQVHAGDPIAILGPKSNKYGVFVSAFYLDESKVQAVLQSPSNQPKYLYTYLPLKFYTPDHSSLEYNKDYLVTRPKK